MTAKSEIRPELTAGPISRNPRPEKVEAERTRAAYLSSMNVADDKRSLAEQAKAGLYRLVAARQVADLMESTDPAIAANRIDEIVFAKLKSLGIQPALCSDSVFIRRAYLDLTGKLPTAPKPNPVNLIRVYELGAGDVFTGEKAGTADNQGNFPEGTLFGGVQKKLAKYMNQALKFKSTEKYGI